MTKFAPFAALVCAAALAGCGGGGSPALGTDYAPSFAGSWTGTLVVTSNGQSRSLTTGLDLAAKGVNRLELSQFCPDGSGLSASVTAPSHFQVDGHACPSVAMGSCAAVAVTVQRGSGSLDSAGKTLTFLVDATESGCEKAISLSLQFTGTRYDPPPVASVTLSPAAPLATDDITAEVSAYDPDGDPLTVSYAWERNGVVLPGQTGATLPAGSARPGDYVTVVVTVSDGTSATSATASLALPGYSANRPPVVDVTLSPTSPLASDDITAHVDASDPDGDPLAISYAWKRNGAVIPGQTGASLPAGFAAVGDVITVVATASDGRTSTTAEASVSVPPFVLSGSPPAQVDAGQGVSFQLSATSADGSQPGAFALEYGPAGMTVSPAGLVTWTASLPMFDRSIDVHYAVSVAGSPASRFTGTIQVADPQRQLPLYRTGIEIPVWHSGLQVADVDGDGRAEMLVASSSGVYELARSGSGYAQRWAYPFSPGDTDTVQAIAARDLDGDGKPEIFFATGDLLVQLDGASRREAVRYESDGAFSCRDLKIADLDLDGSLELVCLGGASTYSYDTAGKVVVFDAKSLTVKWQTASLSSLGGTLAVGNVDGDPALEIVTSGGYVFDGATQQNEWAYGPGFGRVVDVGDLDGDGVAEIVGMQDWGAFRGYSATLKSPLWEEPRFNAGALLVADIDGDGKAEILIGDAQWGNVTAYRYAAATNTLSTIFDLGGQGSVGAIGVGDVDGDGANEFVFSSEPQSGDFGTMSLLVAGLNPGVTVEWMSAAPAQLDGPFVGARPAHLGTGADRLLFAVASTNSGYAGTRLLALDPATGLFQVSQELGSNWNRRASFDVSDYDGDGVDEVLLGTSDLYDGYFTAFDFAANSAEWTSAKLSSDAVAAVTRADLNGDGYADLVAVTTDGYVQAHDVRNQALWKSTGLGSSGVDVAVADLDGDGAAEIIALASGRVVVYHRAAGAVGYIESASQPVTSGVDLLVADADGDGTPEIYVLENTYAGASILRFGPALNALGSISLDAPVQSLHLEDLGAGHENLVVSVGSPGAYPLSTTRPQLRALDPRTGAEIWRSPVLWGTVPINSLSYVDVKGDGSRELAFGTTYGMYLTR